MSKIIVVDDEQDVHKTIKRILSPLHFQYDEDISISYYKNYNEQLEKEIHDLSQRKIYILDIDLQSRLTGINIASKIREEDWDSEIIFITNHDKYQYKVYDTVFKVFKFIEKFDHLEERLEECLRLILNKKENKKIYTYKSNSISLKLYMKDILYIYRDKDERKLVIMTSNNSFIINKTINQILKELDNRFKQVHRSCIVNTHRVVEYLWNKGIFILDNNEEVNMLSKNYKQEELV